MENLDREFTCVLHANAAIVISCGIHFTGSYPKFDNVAADWQHSLLHACTCCNRLNATRVNRPTVHATEDVRHTAISSKARFHDKSHQAPHCGKAVVP